MKKYYSSDGDEIIVPEYCELVNRGGKVYIRARKEAMARKYFYVFPEFFDEIASFSNALAVYAYLRKECKFDTGEVVISVNDLAKAVNKSQSVVSKALKELKEKQLIIMDRRNSIVLNPYLTWRGTVAKYKTLVNESSNEFIEEL